MAWNSFPAGLFTAGAILTAAEMNTYMRDNLTQLRGDFDISRGTTNVVLNSTVWANVSGPADLALTAATGDVVEVSFSALWQNEAVDGFLDAVSIVAGSPVNSFAQDGAPVNTSQGIMAWRGVSGQQIAIGGNFFRVLTAGDISGGLVTIRLRYRTGTATNKTLLGSTDYQQVFAARNYGPVQS